MFRRYCVASFPALSSPFEPSEPKSVGYVVVYSEWVLAKLRKRIARDRMFTGNGTIGAAVSGGADSVALLHALRTLFPERTIASVHLNHCLRGADSDADEAFVRKLAAQLGCEHFVRREDVSLSGGNLERAGRHARYRFFEELLADGSCSEIATGHTQSDQAETVLFRLLRGACGGGLSGVWPVYGERIFRPMLDVTRGEVLEYLERSGLDWREDASNSDPCFARNRLRHGLLPQLRQEWNSNLDSVLAHTADWAVEEERFWNRRIAELGARCVEHGSAETILDVQQLQALGVAEQRRVLLAALRDPALGCSNFGFEHVESLRALVLAQCGSGVVELPGVRAERSFGHVRLRRQGATESAAYDLPLPVPGQVPLPGVDRCVISTRVLETASAAMLYDKKAIVLLDWDRVPKSLRLRSWRDGDRYNPAGSDSPRKIKDLFQQSRISAWNRAGWPVVASDDADGGRIVWARAFGPAREFAVRPTSRRALVVEELGADEAGW